MGWISVEERLPEVGVAGSKRVLVYDHVCGQLVGWLRPEDWWADGFSGSPLVDVTHWQPLPGPPGEANDDRP